MSEGQHPKQRELNVQVDHLCVSEDVLWLGRSEEVSQASAGEEHDEGGGIGRRGHDRS